MHWLQVLRQTGNRDNTMGTVSFVEQVHQELRSLRDEVQALSRIMKRDREGTLSTEHPYIVRIKGVRGGEPIIRGTGISARTIVERFRLLNETPEQIASAYPPLSMSQVYAALSYYCDHPLEIEAYVTENEAALWKKLPLESDST